MCIFITRYVYVTKIFGLLKIYAKYILLIPRRFRIRYCDFNINNIFQFILSTNSVRVYYFTGDSDLHFFKHQETIVFLVSIFIH
jgi:hypothetical protein